MIPSGQIGLFAMASPPTGWLKCKGQAVSRATYAALFTAIGITYGAGDNLSTFNLPDLRGQFVRGYNEDSADGDDDGRVLGSSQAGQNLSHSHGDGSLSTGSGGSHTHSVYGTTSSSGGVENRPKNIALAYFIKT